MNWEFDMRQAGLPTTPGENRERVPLAQYLRWIALASTDPQLVDRLTALARHFEDLRDGCGDPEGPELAGAA